MSGERLTAEALRADIDKLERRLRSPSRKKKPRLYTFSHMVMGGIMMMFFVGVALGVYATITRVDELTVTLDFIMELARIVALGYFIKAFGENIAKIVLAAIFGNRVQNPNNSDGGGASG